MSPIRCTGWGRSRHDVALPRSAFREFVPRSAFLVPRCFRARPTRNEEPGTRNALTSFGLRLAEWYEHGMMWSLDHPKTVFASSIIMTVAVVPVGVLTAIYLSEYAPPESRVARWVRLAVANLAGVPSIVFGLFGLGFFIQFIGVGLDRALGLDVHWGQPCILWAALTLALLNLPLLRPQESATLHAIILRGRRDRARPARGDSGACYRRKGGDLLVMRYCKTCSPCAQRCATCRVSSACTSA